jgi:hypothetical protein
VDGSNSVQLFHSGPNKSDQGNPGKILVGFDKVFVKAGEESESIVFIVERWIEGNCMGSIRSQLALAAEYSTQIIVGDM